MEKYHSDIIMNKPVYINERRAGNTTRIIDYLIQIFFTTGSVGVMDHHFSSNAINDYNNLNNIAFTIEKRLKNEHPFVKYNIERTTQGIRFNIHE